MRRDNDLVRDLLLRLESLPLEPGRTYAFDLAGEDQDLAFEGHSEAAVAHHLYLLISAGFINGKREMSGEFVMKAPILSWAGAEFVDTVRDDRIWSKTKEGAAKVGAASLDALFKMAGAYMRHEVQSRLGLNIG